MFTVDYEYIENCKTQREKKLLEKNRAEMNVPNLFRPVYSQQVRGTPTALKFGLSSQLTRRPNPNPLIMKLIPRSFADVIYS